MATGAPSLVSMVQSTIGRNIANLQDLGDISYDLARPILRQVTNPEQLRSLELASPQIAANNTEIWMALIRRHIPNTRNKDLRPEGSDIWSYEYYCKLKDEEQRVYQEQEDQLRKALTKLDKKKEANRSQILHRVIQEDVRRLPKFVDGRPNPLANYSNDGKETKTSLRNAKGGAQIIRALRQQSRQSVQAKRFSQPFGATPIKPPQAAGSKIAMSRHADRESRGERSLRLALGSEAKKNEQLRQERRQAQKARRQQSIHNTFNPGARAESRSLSPPTTPPRQPVERPSISRTPSPFKSPSANTHMIPANNADPVAPGGKTGSPIPTITLNQDEKPKIPVYVLPAARRKPVSIFAPKPKRRV